MCRLRAISLLFLLYAVVCLASNAHRHRTSLRPRALVRTGRSQLPAFDRSSFPLFSPDTHSSNHIILRHQLRRQQLEDQEQWQPELLESIAYSHLLNSEKKQFPMWIDLAEKLENIVIDIKKSQEQVARLKLQLMRTQD